MVGPLCCSGASPDWKAPRYHVSSLAPPFPRSTTGSQQPLLPGHFLWVRIFTPLGTPASRRQQGFAGRYRFGKPAAPVFQGGPSPTELRLDRGGERAGRSRVADGVLSPRATLAGMRGFAHGGPSPPPGRRRL